MGIKLKSESLICRTVYSMMGLEKSMVEGSIALDRFERHARPEKRRKSLLDTFGSFGSFL